MEGSKFIESKGLQIAYLEKNPDKNNTIFFIHGNSGSSQLWEKQLNDGLFSDYRLIAFDLPAHGQSSASRESEKDYSVVGIADIIANAVLMIAHGNPFILTGFSLGTNIVVEMLAFSIIPRGIILIGADLIGGKYTLQDAIFPGADSSVLFKDDIDIEALRSYARLASVSTNDADRELIISDYYKVQPSFRSTLLKTAMEGKFSDEISLLNGSGVSSLFVYGEEEKLLNVDYLKGADLPIWRNTIFKIPAAGHFVNIDQPKKFNDLLFEYSKLVFTQDYSA
jgi:pimeloyl-ACP methyl ester carboxylesterase